MILFVLGSREWMVLTTTPMSGDSYRVEGSMQPKPEPKRPKPDHPYANPVITLAPGSFSIRLSMIMAIFLKPRP